MRRPDLPRRHALRAVFASIALLCGLGHAMGALDCRHPKAKLDRVICVTPALRDQEAALDRAFAEAQNRNPGQAADTQAGQRTWLSDRDAACATPNRAALERCLAAQARFRLSVLAAVPAAPPAAALPVAPPSAAVLPAADVPGGDGLDPGAYLAEAVTLRLGPDGRFDLQEIGGPRQAGGRYAYAGGVLTFADGQGDIGRTRFPLRCRVLRTAAGFAVLLGQPDCHPFDGLSFRKAE